MTPMVQFFITKAPLDEWMQQIEHIRRRITQCACDETFMIYFDQDITRDYLSPWRIVTLACLFELAVSEDDRIVEFASNEDVSSLFMEDLHLAQYFKDVPYIASEIDTVMNLWRVESDRTYGYSNSLTQYLKSEYFRGKDLNAFTNALNELYANVADHSKAGRVAYSYIKYDTLRRVICVSFCDFGIGIPGSLKGAGINPPQENRYVEYAMKPGISARSSNHNAGLGLDDVLSLVVDTDMQLRIVSNDEVYENKPSTIGREEQTRVLDFCFNGTLIDFEFDVSSLDDEEVIGEGDLFGDINW